MLTVELSCDDPRSLADHARAGEVVAFAAESIGLASSADYCVGLRLADSDEISRLHDTFFGDPSDTDVMSFPVDEAVSAAGGYLGDIAISLNVATAQAREQGHSVTTEVAFLAVHGLLHLVGYDDGTDYQRREMQAIQNRILKEFENKHGAL